MPTDADMLSHILRALSERRIDEAVRLGEELANREARRGHTRVARKLRGALTFGDEATDATPIGQPLAAALLPVAPVESLDMVELPSTMRAQLTEIVQEWRLREKLEMAGVSRRTKLLLHGRPGCGKTLIARALGGEMSLPVLVVRFDGVVGSYLGQTAARLRELFRYAETIPAVLVLDEVDALAQRRGNARDVGELDRVVISLLQELEHSTSQGLIVASSNLPGSLDDALWRRFDLVLDIPTPTRSQLLSFAERRMGALGHHRSKGSTSAFRKARSYAEVERIVADIHRRSILTREME
jgi:SpoVK/Ycf46/Vps4 family AAA+-type ATPase